MTEVGAIVGDRYHIVGELGRGGMGVVYLGRDLRRDMDVAIKLCGRKSADAMLWLKREFRVVASLRHPNLVELFELVAHERSCYFTMEYVIGVDPRRYVARPVETVVHEHTTSTLAPLRAIATRPGVPTPEVPEVDFSRARSVLAQIAESLAFLHSRGVIHRDVKPSNVLVANGTAKLLDFGLALERGRIDEELAREMRIVGTAAYLAPEYVEKLVVTPAVDVYALGVLAFQLVAGVSPFGDTPHVVSRERRSLVVPRASRINPEVPRDLDELIDQMLAANPARRPGALQVAMRLAGSLSQPRPLRRAQHFVGRERELAQLARHIADPAPRARFMVVTGPSGVGKTALVEEAVGRARLAGTLPELVWRGRCHERELVPFRAFDFVIDDLAAELAHDDELADPVEHHGALARMFPALGTALDDSSPAAGDLRVERERALIAMTQLFDRVIGAQQGLIVIDDLQWADEDSLELLAIVVARVARPLAIVATWSDDEATALRLAAIIERLGAAAEILELAPMGAAELAELIGDVAPGAPAVRLEAAAAVAAGSPYLAELLGRELYETGAVDPRNSEARRLARLTEPERAVTELTALATSGTTFEQLQALAELPSARLGSVLRALEDARVIKVSPSAGGEPLYTLYHQRLRDAARAAIATETRRALHLKFARLGERDRAPPEQLAHHFEQAGERADAARWATVAADGARAQLAWGVAADWYERALALGAHECRQQLAECLFLGGKLAEAADNFEQLAAHATDTEAGERWRVRAAEAYIKLGELERGLAILDGVLARRGQPRAKSRVGGVARTLGVAARWLLPARPPAGRADDVLAAAYRVIASFLSTPYPIESFEYVLRGIAAAERAGDRDARGLGMAMLAAYLGVGSLGRFGDRAIAAAHRLSTESGAPYPRMVAAGAAGILATLRGDWAGMRRAHDEGHRICMRLGMQRSWEASFLRTYQALGEYYAGEPERALAILYELADASDELISRAMLGSYRGRALLLGGNLAAARAQEQELERSPATQRGLAAIYRQVFAGELALAEHDWLRAEAIGHELQRSARAQWLTAMPAVSAMVDTLLATAELGRGDRDSAAHARSRARALFRRARHSFYAPTALRLWAQAELRLGNTGAANMILARASALAGKRGGKIDRLAIAGLLGTAVESGPLAFAVRWNTGGMV
jgi:eukaryotic-like serine/threonine-protein kinase